MRHNARYSSQIAVIIDRQCPEKPIQYTYSVLVRSRPVEKPDENPIHDGELALLIARTLTDASRLTAPRMTDDHACKRSRVIQWRSGHLSLRYHLKNALSTIHGVTVHGFRRYT